MTDTQDDCRRAFERWYNDFPVGGRAEKEGLAWTVWQAAWSSRPQPNVDELVEQMERIRPINPQDSPKEAEAIDIAVNQAIALIRKWATKGEL